MLMERTAGPVAGTGWAAGWQSGSVGTEGNRGRSRARELAGVV